MKSIKMFQIHQRIRLEHFQNFRGLLAHGFAHAKVKKLIFNRKILELVGEFGIILNDFQSLFYSSIKIWVKLLWVKILKSPEFNLMMKINVFCNSLAVRIKKWNIFVIF